MLHTVGRFIYTKYWRVLCLKLREDVFTQHTGEYFMLNTVGSLFTQNTGEILSVEHCGKIYLHNIPNNTFC